VTFRVEPLGDQHHIDTFDSGHAALDEWLRIHARHATGQGTRTYVLVDDDRERIAGFFAVAPHLLQRDDVPGRVGRGSPARIPAILLAKLALDATYQGRALGAELLLRALETMLAAARKAGGKVAVVGALDDDDDRFHRHHDFTPLAGNPHRLVLKLSTVARILRQPWP
jgi:GNAT superfamily N-acetyltransferase